MAYQATSDTGEAGGESDVTRKPKAATDVRCEQRGRKSCVQPQGPSHVARNSGQAGAMHVDDRRLSAVAIPGNVHAMRLRLRWQRVCAQRSVRAAFPAFPNEVVVPKAFVRGRQGVANVFPATLGIGT